MTYRTSNWVGGLAALTLVIALPATAPAAGIVLEGGLVSPVLPDGRGMVEYQANRGGTEAKLRINLENVIIARSSAVYVVIQGQYVGTISLDEYGDGGLHLSTRRGDNVPTLQAGDVVTIYQAGSTTKILLQGMVH